MWKASLVTTVLALGASLFPIAAEGTSDQVLSAMKSDLRADKDFKTLHDFITSSRTEEKWRAIPWIPELWTAVQTGEKDKRPIFVWAMNGNPLGCV